MQNRINLISPILAFVGSRLDSEIAAISSILKVGSEDQLKKIMNILNEYPEFADIFFDNLLQKRNINLENENSEEKKKKMAEIDEEILSHIK